ncbi:DUF6252 family protein [Mucilaginibacter paludis]|uniref:Lipocalin-like domain-containing protein n=1 Tax=Mucilaginibacter paludis DSM 18603 TaxID=714943 RepID=H1Y3E5_9SPHI|nr:DUF6252 family protein [Mucilaginibacter paludis]EHQ29300.1 hypothetical protein Mucpa_5225 [Mucilaginibacter paludis DSM 18603]
MKKLSLIVLSLLSVILIEACKKSSSDDSSTTTTPTFQVYVNDSLWTPRSVTAVLTYDSKAQTKTLTCTGIDTTDKIVWNIKQPASSLDSTFTSKTYYVSDTANVKPMYYKLNSSNVFVATGTIKSGNITISSFDAKSKVMTGTFAFVTTKLNYDSNGNVTSITANNITSGQFNSFAFTFQKQ